MKKSVWHVLLLSGVVALTACAQKTEEATADPGEEQDVPMSAKPAEPTVVVQNDAGEIEEVVPEAFAQNEEEVEIAEVVEIDETAETATQDAEVQEGR